MDQDVWVNCLIDPDGLRHADVVGGEAERGPGGVQRQQQEQPGYPGVLHHDLPGLAASLLVRSAGAGPCLPCTARLGNCLTARKDQQRPAAPQDRSALPARSAGATVSVTSASDCIGGAATQTHLPAAFPDSK